MDTTTATCAACGAHDQVRPCDGLGELCARCRMECPCTTCTA